MLYSTWANEQVLSAHASATRDYMDAINSSYPNPSIQQICQLDSAYREAYESLPPYLRQEIPQQMETHPSQTHRDLVWQRAFINLTMRNRIMRLHRGFMSRGYSDPEYLFSRVTCLESAKAYITLVLELQVLGFPGLKWWVVVVHLCE